MLKSPASRCTQQNTEEFLAGRPPPNIGEWLRPALMRFCSLHPEMGFALQARLMADVPEFIEEEVRACTRLSPVARSNAILPLFRVHDYCVIAIATISLTSVICRCTEAEAERHGPRPSGS